MEIVFRSQSCFNGSFLQSNEEHYCCTSKHHGVDLKKAENIFNEIARIENESITDLVIKRDFIQMIDLTWIFANKTLNFQLWDGIVEYLIPSLVSSPPDVETLRIYLTLPLYHQFENPKHCDKLQAPFAKKAMSLKAEASKIVGK